MNSCACAIRASRSTSCWSRSPAPKAMFSRTVAENRKGSCEITPIELRSDDSFTSRTSTPSTSTRPLVTSEQHGSLCDERHPRDDRHVERPLAIRADRLPEDLLGPRLELPLLLWLLRERLDDVDADDVLLGDRRDVGELLLHLA